MAQGVTRVREPYAITAPLTGIATRSPVEIGDNVIAGDGGGHDPAGRYHIGQSGCTSRA
jgi:hypothetical protein